MAGGAELSAILAGAKLARAHMGRLLGLAAGLEYKTWVAAGWPKETMQQL